MFLLWHILQIYAVKDLKNLLDGRAVQFMLERGRGIGSLVQPLHRTACVSRYDVTQLIKESLYSNELW